MAYTCLHNMCIASSNGFDMDQALEAQKYAQIETNTTFRNLTFVCCIFSNEKDLKEQLKCQGLVLDL